MQCNWDGTDFFVITGEITWNTTAKCEHKHYAVCSWSWLSLWFYCVKTLECSAVFELIE